MKWRAIPGGQTATLGDYRRYAGCRLLIVCADCGLSKDYNPERVIARLHELRAGGYPTFLPQVAARVGRRCPRCHQATWRAEFAWPPGLSESEIKRLADRSRN